MNDPLERFFRRIKDKALDVSQPPVLIVALGDSVTQGCMELGRLDPAVIFHRLLSSRASSTSFDHSVQYPQAVQEPRPKEG